MARCNSCGGVLGRDCWNPSDCADISRQIANDQAYDDYLRSRSLFQILKDWVKTRYDNFKNPINESDIPW